MDKQKLLVWIKKILPVFYFLLGGGLCVYIALRTRLWLNLILKVETGYVVGGLMIAFFIMSACVEKKYLVASGRIRTYIAGISTFVVMYLLIAIAASDLIQSLLNLVITDRLIREKIFFLSGFVCLFFVVIITGYAYHKTKVIKEVNEHLSYPKMQGHCRMILLSDLHIGYYVGVEHIRNIVKKINFLDADMVVIAGDLINAGNTRECPEIDEVAKLLSQIRSKEGTYAIVGNHDPKVTDSDFLTFLNTSHITLLDDSIYTNGRFHLIGRHTCEEERKTMDELEEGLSDRLPVFVLDHDPMGISEAADAGADLILCGHTHRGQVFPLNLFVRILYSKQEFWGRSKVKDSDVIVSAGAGYFSMPMRLGSDCELICLDIN